MMTYFIQNGDFLIEVKGEIIVKSHPIPLTNKGFKNLLRDVVRLKTQSPK